MGANSLLSLPALTTITTDTTQASSLSQVEALNGGDVQLPVLDKVSGGPVLFRSNGAGGKLDIGTLTSIVGPAGQDNDTTLEADGGGLLVASALTSIGGADVVVVANGTGSEVSLPKLATITADTTRASSLTEVEALNGGDIELPVLDQVSGGAVLLRSNGAGGELDIPKLQSLVGFAGQANVSTLEADGGGSIVATDLKSISGANVLVSAGSQLTLPALTSYTGGVGYATILEASGANSLLSLPALKTIIADTAQASSSTEVEAINGGDIELPVLDQVIGPVQFVCTGAGSKLDIGH